MAHRNWPWSELDLDPTADRAEIKRAYAAKLKTLDRERDVEAFQALREAYEAALRHGRQELETERDSFGDSGSQRPVCMADDASHPSVDVIDFAQIAERIASFAPMCLGTEDAEQAFAALPLIADPALYDLLSSDVATKLVNRDDISWTALCVIADRLGWDDVSRMATMHPALRLALNSWLHRCALEAGVVADSSDRPVRRNVDDLKQSLKPPFGMLRAFLIGVKLDQQLDKQFFEFTRRYGKEWPAVLDSRAFDFVEAFSGRRFDLGVWTGRVIGRSLAVGFWFCCAALFTAMFKTTAHLSEKIAWSAVCASGLVVLIEMGRTLRSGYRASPQALFVFMVMMLAGLIGVGTAILHWPSGQGGAV